ncbi:ribonucleoside-diphosphate reductase subunit alpha [Arhodomonas aquaeolei]|uniref:ribonucleoside-diphosphate reductase subunit alpha n=1 Tax=Arhodomonas aquaeolei TaxID=2369 RepID=UPI00036D8412
MQTVSATAAVAGDPAAERPPRVDLDVVKRNGTVADFDPQRISVAMTRAFLAVEGEAARDSRRIHDTVARLTDEVVAAVARRPEGATVHIEDIQDQVELALMRAGEHRVARAYVLYREERARERAAAEPPEAPPAPATFHVTAADGTRHPLDEARLERVVREACEGLADVDAERVLTEARRNLYDGVTETELEQALVMAARMLIEREPDYSAVAARLLLDALRREALSFVHAERREATQAEMTAGYAEYFPAYIRRGVDEQLLDPRLLEFDLERLGRALEAGRDLQFGYLGLQTLYDRYLQHVGETRFELPQAFFMRVAMGLALEEIDREAQAETFYDLLSSFDFMSSTPTLFNAGTLRPQLSSCYLTTIGDDLDRIYSGIRDNALLSKFAGGLGNDWTRVRAMGAHIRGTNGTSQGVVPFLKVANDTAVAVNQGGKRKGAVCAYLEVWHRDIEDFLELRKNTGDERRRTHDMNTACWVPDLFMKRVHEQGQWTLFSPDEVPDLHDLTGEAFEARYRDYEAAAERGEMRTARRISAVQLWRRMLTMLFETGHPWITFKDPCNLRSPQQHTGVVHSSNLCTEITLNTSDDEIAVCNLGSVNLAAHVVDGALDHERLQRTVTTAMRMLDNVIDINYYSVPAARRANLRHRPVGLGLMGFHDALYRLRLPYDSEAAVAFADESMEAISYYAIRASTDLAAERGRYASFEGSLWSRGVLPIDSQRLLAEARDGHLEVDTTERLDWVALRERVQQVGMRNSNCLAIAPTATIANITGISQGIEPTFQNLYVKSNLSGEFTVVNPYLVCDLKAHGLWDEVMVNDLKYFDGSVGPIDRVPDELKRLYATAFEVDPHRLVDAGSRRQKWLDQSQSLNLYMAEPSGPRLDALYRHAWTAGLKTTYYLRSRGATAVESTAAPVSAAGEEGADVCAIDDPECEACQ